MSNLTLPKLTYATLDARIRDYRGTRHDVPIAYATTAHRDRYNAVQGIVIEHHGNPIAFVSDTLLVIHHAGYNTPTTANRLNTVLWDNLDSAGEYTPHYNVAMRGGKRGREAQQGTMYLTERWTTGCPAYGIAQDAQFQRALDKGSIAFSRDVHTEVINGHAWPVHSRWELNGGALATRP